MMDSDRFDHEGNSGTTSIAKTWTEWAERFSGADPDFLGEGDHDEVRASDSEGCGQD